MSWNRNSVGGRAPAGYFSGMLHHRSRTKDRRLGFVGVAGGLAGLVIASAASSLEIRPAVELAFPTALSQGYQVQASDALNGWAPFGQAVLGDGQTLRVLVAAADSHQFFQLESHPVRDLASLLEPIRKANNVPALACAVIVSNRIVGLGVVGVRRTGVTNAPVTVLDKWHHGSLTKSMTATLAALLVADGKVRWETTLAEVFPDWAPKMSPLWRGATLEQLTSNRGGAPGDLTPGGVWAQLWNYPGTPRDGRQLLLELLTVQPPSSPPGTQYEYSNAGFALAGHLLETVMGRPWEDLLTDRVFIPLGMTSAGFGVPATPRYVDQPWGHQLVNGKPSAIEPGTAADNPPAIGPAATVHCSVIDLARYTAFHIAGHRGGTPLLPQAAFLKLHTAYPNNSDYAHGWEVLSRGWAGNGPALTHSGSNTQWYSVIWMAPARDFGVVALCNLATASGPNPAAAATDQIAGAMITEFLH